MSFFFGGGMESNRFSTNCIAECSLLIPSSDHLHSVFLEIHLDSGTGKCSYKQSMFLH